MLQTRRGFRFAAWMILGAELAAMAGCHSGGGRRRFTTVEPGLSAPIEDSAPIVEGAVTPGRPVTWVDRHPLFSKPREYYEKTDNNAVVKTAAAAVVGVPAGVFGELRQIVTGNPSLPAY